MAAISWPAQLPDSFRADDLRARVRDPVIRTETDGGPVKARLRYTRPPQFFTGTLILDHDERLILDYFYRVTTRFGTLRFNFKNPQTMEIREYRFKAPPDETTLDGWWNVTLELEEL